jgi:N-acyl-D-amino-acid deacylase
MVAPGAESPSGDLLVVGGEVHDGTGSDPFRADVRIREGQIVEIGSSIVREGEPVLDASGAIVAPGFIDSHTHFDPTLYWDPACDPMAQHGVTTILIGNCSLSLAPVLPEHRVAVGRTFGFIEDFPQAVFDETVPWSWSSYPEYAADLARRRFGVHVAALVGHSMLRLFVIGEEAWERPSTGTERVALAGALDAALDAGASGLSWSYFDRDADGRPVPSSVADEAELDALVEVLGRRQAHFEMIPPPASMPAEALERIEACARACAAHGAAMTWNGFVDRPIDRSICETQLDLARRFQAAGSAVIPQISPRPIEVLVNLDQTMSLMYLPAWNDFVRSDHAAKRAMLTDCDWRARAALEWDAQDLFMFPHRRLDLVRITSVARADLEQHVGSTLQSWVDQRGGHPSDAFADWIAINDLRPGLLYVAGNDDPARVGALCADPATVVSASDAGAHVRMFAAAGDATLLLTRHVRERADLTLPAAIQELTSRPADVFGFEGRGRVARGAAGDLVVFALDELEWAEPVLLDDGPAGTPRLRRPAGGYRATIVAGVPTQLSGESTGALPGRWLPNLHTFKERQ